MALAYHQTQISGRNTSVSVTVPRDNLARLMYYLNSVNSVLAGSPFPSYVTDYMNYDLASPPRRKLCCLQPSSTLMSYWGRSFMQCLVVTPNFKVARMHSLR